MKNEKVKIDPIDEALKLVTLHTEVQSDKGSEGLTLLNIISAEYKSQPSDEDAERMINKLYERLSVDSLGVLINNALSKTNMQLENLSSESSLPVPTIEQLQTDRILANSIPVIPFRNLLKKLQIPFDRAEQAIYKTFQILKDEIAFSSATLGVSKLSYRRRSVSVPPSLNTKTSHSENQYLFQNEEALRKYLKRLNELYEP